MLVRTRNVSDKWWEENQNTYFTFKIFILKIVPFFKIIWKKKHGTSRQAADDKCNIRYKGCDFHAGKTKTRNTDTYTHNF